MQKQYIFNKSGSVVNIIAGSEHTIQVNKNSPKLPSVNVKRVDSGKEMSVVLSSLREFSYTDKKEYSEGYWSKYLNQENFISKMPNVTAKMEEVDCPDCEGTGDGSDAYGRPANCLNCKGFRTISQPVEDQDE